MILRTRFVAALALGAIAFGGAANAADVQLPKRLSWTAYGATSSGYAQSVGLGNMLKKLYGTELRVIPGKNDVSRMIPLKAGQAEICACGAAAYFGQEGVLMFAKKSWGRCRSTISSTISARMVRRWSSLATPASRRSPI